MAESVDIKTSLDIQNNTGETDLNLLSSNSNLVSTLKEINVKCGLTEVPKALFNFKYLTILNLSNNLLENLPDEIGSLCNLVVLVLSRNQLSSLPQSLRYAQRLTYLDISHNKFSQVPGVLYYGARGLQLLDLSYNEITVFDGCPGCLVSLLVLKIADNFIEEFPVWVFDNLCQLQLLDLSKNQLQLNSTIVNSCSTGIFDSLQVLNIENCSLKCEKIQLLSHFKNLQMLRMGNKKYLNCKLDEINYMGNLRTDVFKNCKKLTHLYLQNAHIPTLPSDFGYLKSLEILDLSCNLLSWLPESLCDLTKLRIINLTSNQLLFLPDHIHKLINLEQIHLGNNQLDQVPEGFYNLKYLQFIDLYNNSLDQINPNIFKQKCLKGIDLELNYLCFDFPEHDVDVSEMIKLYTSLKDSFRRNFFCTDSRYDLQKEKSVERFDEKSSDSCSGVWQISSDSAGESLSGTEDPSLDTRGEQIEDEDWEDQDLSENEDENFDPNESSHSQHYYTPWICSFRNNFCPANYTLSHIMQTAMWNPESDSQNDAVKEGQFDSD